MKLVVLAMKYLFINTVAGSGSTGKITADKCRELQAQGHQCVLAYGRSETNCEDICTYRIGTAMDYRIHGLETRLFDRHGLGSVRATRNFLKWVTEYDPDIIWLHNLHGYYINVEMLFDYLKKSEKKVFWTLHDCWAFTGHCTHFIYAGCDKWKTECCHCCQKGRYPKSVLFDRSRQNYCQKKRAFTGVKDMTLITPSQWLEGLIKDSFLKEYKTKVVYNTIDTKVFRPTQGDFRKRYHLEDKWIILGVANVWDKRKGLDDFIKLVGMLDDRYAVVLVGLNQKQIQKISRKIRNIRKKPVKVENFVNLCGDSVCEKIYAEMQTGGGLAITPDIKQLYQCIRNIFPIERTDLHKGNSKLLCLKRTDSANELAEIYTAADVFVNPTYEDNYPTVNLEAQACGTMVITYDVGGCKETLINEGGYGIIDDKN